MHVEQLRSYLESLDQATPLLGGWGIRDVPRGWRNLTHLGKALGVDSLRDLVQPLGRLLPRCPDPDMALNNLERFLARPEGNAHLAALLESRGRILETLLRLFSTSQYCSDILVANPEYLPMLRVPLRRSPSLREMVESLQSEVQAGGDEALMLRAFRQRQVLRIATNDIVRDRPLDEVTRDISRVADASLEVALEVALRTITCRFGQPFTNAGEPARCVILGFGKLGGEELNYSSDIDLMFLYDDEGATRGRKHASISNDEFYSRVLTEVVRLLSSHTNRGQSYRVDLRLRPEGDRGPLARSLASTLAYYDTLGRTWERQALIKVRPVAGDSRLGQQFLQAIEPFVYRKYLSFAEINEIKALKRRIEHKTTRAGVSDTEVKTGHGGIRDIEFIIQFLQLLNGGDRPSLRERNTLQAMQALERAGCLTDQEYHLLSDGYCFLRKVEHRLQMFFDLQTHRLPEGEDELRLFARRMGYGVAPLTEGAEVSETAVSSEDPLELFLQDYRGKTNLNRRILDHLLHQTFVEEEQQARPETDLILDPEPDPETIRSVLGRYPFQDIQKAYNNLVQLAQESVRFLPTPRCRHFLASIAPQLLRAVAQAPDPDLALTNLEKVTASLGAKAVLWELFSFNPPSLKLYVDLCATSPFLSEILINNPGMIDELLDSLVLNQPRTASELKAELSELCRNAAQPDLILHSFQNRELLRIGVRDILGKDTIQETTAALSDVAETILVQICELQIPTQQKRFGIPQIHDPDRNILPCRFVLLGLGKLGSRELNYHSDLDLMLVYEGDGRTGPPPGASRFDRFELTDNFHFFTEFAQRIIKATSVIGPMGRLYQIDMRLRPTGKSGSLVIPLHEFHRYYTGGSAQFWERQALTRARVVYGDPSFGELVMREVAGTIYEIPWRQEFLDEVLSMRERLQSSRGSRNLKRGAGGLADVEFLVQLLQIKYGQKFPAIRSPNTWEALGSMHAAGLIPDADYATLRGSYDFLRLVESRLRLMHNRALDDLPESEGDQEKLARRLGLSPDGHGTVRETFLEELDRCTARTREVFLQRIEQERSLPA